MVVMELVVEPPDLVAHLLAEIGVEVGERLVEQEHRRLHHDGARQGHPLLLAAGQLLRIPRGERLHLDHVENLVHPGLDLRPRPPPYL